MKKGAIILICSSLVFLVASLLFVDHANETTNVDKNVYFDLIKVNNDAEECLFLFDKTAKLALRDALLEDSGGGKTYLQLFKEGSVYTKEVDGKEELMVGAKREILDKFKDVFKVEFRKYNAVVSETCGSNINIYDYKGILFFSSTFTIVGTSENKISFVSGNVTYSVNPNFVANVKF